MKVHPATAKRRLRRPVHRQRSYGIRLEEPIKLRVRTYRRALPILYLLDPKRVEVHPFR